MSGARPGTGLPPPHVPGWWRKLGVRAPRQPEVVCVCPEQAVRGDDWLQGLFHGGMVHDEPDHSDLFVESDGLFELFALNEGGEERKRKPTVYPQCTEDGCKSQGQRRGRCQRHRGETGAPAIKRVRPQCSEDGCMNQGESYGRCKRHSGTSTAATRCSYQDCSSGAKGPSGLCFRHGGATPKRYAKAKEAKEAKAKEAKAKEAKAKAKEAKAKATEAKPSEARLAGGTRAYLTAQGEVPPQQASLPGVSDAAGRAAQAEYQHSGDWDAARVGTVAAAEAEAREAMLVRRYAAPAAAAARGDFREAHELLVALHTELSANPSTRARYVAPA